MQLDPLLVEPHEVREGPLERRLVVVVDGIQGPQDAQLGLHLGAMHVKWEGEKGVGSERTEGA